MTITIPLLCNKLKVLTQIVSHCVKSAQIRSFSWSVFSYIQSKYGKIRTRKNSISGHFSWSVKHMENDLQWRRYLVLVVLEILSPYEHVLATLQEKQTGSVPPLYSWTYFCCNHGLSRKGLLLNRQNYLRRIWEVSLTCFFLLSLSKERSDDDSWRWSFPLGISSVNVTKYAMRCNWAAIAHETKQKALRMKDTFDFTKIVNNHGLMQGTVCKIVRFISHFSLKLHIFFKKYFISLCNVVYVYYKNKMSSIFCQGCLSAFKYRMTI